MKRQFQKSLVVIVALLFALTPYAIDLSSGTLVASMAQAKNDKSNGNGNSGGNSSKGSSKSRGNAYGHEKQKGLSETDTEEDDSVSSISSKLGRLNAAHASATARENASPNSAVGRIAAYEDAVYQRQDAQSQLAALIDAGASDEEIVGAQASLDTATQHEMEALAAAANKEIDQDVIAAVNDLLGIEEPVAEPVEAPEYGWNLEENQVL